MHRAPSSKKSGLPLHLKVALGFAFGMGFGLIVHFLAPGADWVQTVIHYAARPFGTIFLNLLFMMVVPLIFSALVLGVAELGDVATLGRLGGRTLAYTAAVTGIAVMIGLVMTNLFQPGTHMDPALVQQALSSNAGNAEAIVEKGRTLNIVDMLVDIVPHNIVGAMGDDSKKLGIVFFALMFGIGLVMKPTPGTMALKSALQGVFEVSMHLIGLFVKLVPYAVACFMFILCAQMGWGVLVGLGWYVVTVLLALAIHAFVVLPLWVKFMGGMRPRDFFRGSQEALLTAFATASSAAALPVTLRVAEDHLKLPRKVSRFVLTVGASANHHGSALFEGVTVLFLAQVYDMHLPLGEQILVLVLCILGGIGTASIPSGSLPVVAMICGIVGIKPEGIGIILGVNALLDMCRTSLNVGGDLAMAVVVSRQGGGPDAENETLGDAVG